MVCLLALAFLQQDGVPFESKEYGVRLRTPSGWTSEVSRQTGLILKIQQKGQGALNNELAVTEVRTAEPVTPAQYKEQLRIFFLRATREARILDDQPASLAGLPGFILNIENKDASGGIVSVIRAIWMRSPTRLIAIEASGPQSEAEKLRQAIDHVVRTWQWMPKPAPASEGPAKKWIESKSAVKINAKDELEVVVGEKVVGKYISEIRDVERDGVSGYEFSHSHQADFGDAKEEFSVKGFLSADLSRQKIERSYFRVAKDKPSAYLWASAEIKGGKAKIQRKINGESFDAELDAAPGVVMADALESVQIHLFEYGKGLSAVAALNVFDSDPSLVNIDVLGTHKAKIGDQMVEVLAMTVARDERVLTYWYDSNRRLIRLTGMGPSIVIRKK